MVERKAIQAEFDRRSEVEIQRRFKTPEAQKEARDLYGRAADLAERNRSRHEERVKEINRNAQDKPKPFPHPTFARWLFGQHRPEQQKELDQENLRFKSRSDVIQKARDNDLKRLDERRPPRGEGNDGPGGPPRDPSSMAKVKEEPENTEAVARQTDQDRAPAGAERDPVQDHEDHTAAIDQAEPALESATPVSSPSAEAAPEPTEKTWTPAEWEAALEAERQARDDRDRGDDDPGRTR